MLIIASLIWLIALFAVAWWGDRSPRWSHRQTCVIYALALGVYFTSWTYFGTVTQAAHWQVWMPPTLLGVLLLLCLGWPLVRRIAEQVQHHASTSLADLIAAHCGRSPALARLLTLVIVIGSVPYLALQLKAITSSLAMFVPINGVSERWSQLAVAALLLWFALAFGARRAAVDGSHRGLVLAMAGLSLFKLVALLAIGITVWVASPIEWPLAALQQARLARSDPDYLSWVALGAIAFISLPHVFHIVMAELKPSSALTPVAKLFGGYLLLIALPILPLAVLGQQLLPPQISGDVYTLALPRALNLDALSVLGFLGGLSAATGMVIVTAHALGIMVAQHWFASGLLRLALRDEQVNTDGSQTQAQLLRQRRGAIVLVFALAYGFAVWIAGERSLADIGVLSMGALAQLMPALVCVAFGWRLSAFAAGLAVVVGLSSLIALQWSPAHTSFTVLAAMLFNATALVIGQRRVARSLQPVAPSLGTLERVAQRFLSADQLHAWRQSGPDALALQQSLQARLAPLIGASSAHVLLTRTQTSAVGTFEAVADLVDASSQDIRFNQRLLHTALENMSQGISVVDEQLCLVAWNAPYARLFGFPAHLLRVGTPITELIRFNIEHGLLGETASEQIEANLQRRLARMHQGQAYVAERELADGTVLQIRGNPMPGGGFVATFTDVTAFRRAEIALKLNNETLEARVEARTRELTAATEQVAQAVQAKSRFLTALGHDLLQPVNAAQLYAHALRLELKQQQQIDPPAAQPSNEASVEASPEPSASRTLRHLEGALQSATELLQSLLDMARLDTDRLKVEARSVSVDVLLEQLVRDCIVLAEARGLALRYRHCGLHIHSDPQLLRRILQNFLINALRYTEQGGVLIGAQRRGDQVWIRVFDTGPGIAPQDQARIFEAFERLPAPTGGGEGLGLGLTIARRMCELLGHPLLLSSTLGRGSSFGLIAPAAQAQAPAPVPSMLSEFPSIWAGIAANKAGSSALVAWIVDNHGPSLDALARLLSSWNVRVHTHSSFSEALAAPKLEANVWLFDYHLENEQTGLALYQTLRAQHFPMQSHPCVIVSADGSDALRQAVQAASLSLLAKPIRPLALRSVLDQLLRQSR